MGFLYHNTSFTPENMNHQLQAIKQRFGIIGVSKQLDTTLDTAIRVAPTELSVLITGESGVGKEAFSKIIHALSIRKHNPFIAINCGAIASRCSLRTRAARASWATRTCRSTSRTSTTTRPSSLRASTSATSPRTAPPVSPHDLDVLTLCS